MTVPARLSSRFVTPAPFGAEPKTPNQLAYAQALRDKRVVVVTAPAGTGKTMLAVAAAVRAFQEGRVERILMARPAVECGEKIGYLPGGVEEKLAHFAAPMVAYFKEHYTPQEYAALVDAELISLLPVAFIRGVTFKRSVTVVDESQNLTVSQLKGLLSRVGDRSRLVLLGDPAQCDLPGYPRAEGVPFARLAVRLADHPDPDVAVCRMGREDVARDRLVAFFDDVLTDL